MLIFEFNQSAFVEYPDEILVLGQTSANGTKKEEAMEIPSLLGVDILKDYAIKFRNQKIILERWEKSERISMSIGSCDILLISKF